MLKKSAALITCVMLVLTLLAGCGGDTNSASGTAAGSENIEINIVSSTMRLESMVDGWEQMIANFEAENPGVTVNLDMQDWEDSRRSILRRREWRASKLTSSAPPAGRFVPPWPRRGALMDITDVGRAHCRRLLHGGHTGCLQYWRAPVGHPLQRHRSKLRLLQQDHV